MNTTHGVLAALPAILEASGEAIASIDCAGQVVGCNSQFQSMFNLEDRWNIKIRDYLPNFFPDQSIEKIKDYQAFLLKRKDEVDAWVLIKVIPVGADECKYFTVFIQEPETFRRIIDRLDYIENFDQETGLFNRRKGLIEFEQLLFSQLSGGAFLINIGTEKEHQDNATIFSSVTKCFSVLGNELIISRHSDNQLLVVYTSNNPLSVDGFNLIVESIKYNIKLQNKDQIYLAFADWIGGALSVNTLLEYLYSTLRNINDDQLHDELRDQERLSSNTSYLNSLYKAMDANEFLFYIQPQFSTQTHTMIGGELLVRWVTKSGKIIPPSEFINFIEEGDFSYRFFTWSIFSTVCALKEIKEKTGNWVPLSLNLAPTHIQDRNLVELLVNILKKHEIPEDILEVEITERILAVDYENLLSNLNYLSEKGINIAIDDFGTGYSSLSYLRKFPLNRLKIDRIFVSNINSNEEDRLIVSSIVSLAHVLGLEVVAEGVEESSQIAFLYQTGCEYLQGFYTSRPIPVSDFIEMINKNEKSQSWNENLVSYVDDHKLDKSPKVIKWKKSFSTELVAIDEEHRELVDVLNNFATLYHENPKNVDVIETFDLIASEAIKHFRHEEIMMYNMRYPRYKSHKSKHEDLIADISRRKEELSQDINKLNFEEVIKYLKYWLLRHLVSEDTHLRRYLNKEISDGNQRSVT